MWRDPVNSICSVAVNLRALPGAALVRRPKSFKVVPLLLSLVWLVTSASCGGPGEEERISPKKETPRPNIVLVVSDALRQDVLGCYGGEARTPNIDRLAGRGVLFENAYSTSPWTPPSAVSIFTGNYATSYPYSEFEKTVKVHVPDDETLLAEKLRELGYDTALKNGNFQAGLHNCFQGFEILPDDVVLTKAATVSIGQITALRVRDSMGYVNSVSVLNRLLSLPKGKNFFLVHWMLDPHEPFTPPDRFAKRIVVDQAGLTKPPEEYTRSINIEGKLNETETKYLKARYIAEVESVDERIGYVQKMLDHKQLLDTTYFVFTADHGELFGEHDLFGHGINYFEELLRVPLLITGPGLPEGKRVKAPVSLVNLMVTLKDLLGVEYEHNMQGKSFKDLIFDESGDTGPLYFDDVREHVRVDALLDKGFKLIALKEGTFELYDLSNDARERNNIAAANEDRAQAMLSRIMARRRANAERQAANLTRLDGSTNELSQEEKEELEKKLRALGYIQ